MLREGHEIMKKPMWTAEAVKAYESGQGVVLVEKPYPHYEPVAVYRAGQAEGEVYHVQFLKEMEADEVLLYAKPQDFKLLTDDEILLISAECAASHQHTDIHFARAIEAKLKEKNT